MGRKKKVDLGVELPSTEIPNPDCGPKSIDAIGANSIRDLVAEANEIGLTKQDIISIVSVEGQFYMVYEQ